MCIIRIGQISIFFFLLCFPSVSLSSWSAVTANTKGFTGTETRDGVWVSSQAQEVLTSRLTTVFLPVVYIIVFVVGLPTNALAIWVFLFRTKKKHPSSIYMANLALADLLFVIWVPMKIAYHFNGNNWTYGDGLCKVLVAFFYGNMYCSIAFIACISVQRYWAVVHPLSQQQRSNRLAVIISVAIWVVVWLITTPLYLYDQEVRARNLNILTCHDVTRPSQKKIAAGYFLTMGTLGFVLPTVVCIISYVLMLKSLRNSMSDPTIAKKRKKAVVLIITVLVMFLVCFTPSNVMLLVHYILLLGEAENNLYGFYITTLCLASLNSCFDPFVYYFISEDFREHVKNTFLCRSERTVERMRVSFSALKYSKKNNTYTSESGNTQSTEC
uniref:Coagulation factor II (thrombin) receptor-like 1, tandem duplicate 1 n=1 Tax=Acanthochromis polyacanthus TaxID=80966 RepID=A0A3Q1GU26_9TELE